jgi:hypothetical protein
MTVHTNSIENNIKQTAPIECDGKMHFQKHNGTITFIGICDCQKSTILTESEAKPYQVPCD